MSHEARIKSLQTEINRLNDLMAPYEYRATQENKITSLMKNPMYKKLYEMQSLLIEERYALMHRPMGSK